MDNNSLAKRPNGPIKVPDRGYVVINGQRHIVRIEPVQRAELIAQQPDPRPAQYKTMAERGITAQQLPAFRAPSMMQVSAAAIVAMSFLVAASMFSIALTAYSNSVDRVDQQRSPSPFIRVEP